MLLEGFLVGFIILNFNFFKILKKGYYMKHPSQESIVVRMTYRTLMKTEPQPANFLKNPKEKPKNNNLSKDIVAEMVSDYKSLKEKEKKMDMNFHIGWQSKELKEKKSQLQ